MSKYAILDSAILEGHRYFGLEQAIQYQSLFMGKTGELLDSVAPYLLEIKEDHEEFITWFVQSKRHTTGGIILNSNVLFRDLHKHFRNFLYVKTEESKKLYFRYYDPRVLPTFLRSCTKEQLSEFFGPVQSFNLFANEDKVLAFSLIDQRLREVENDYDISKYKLQPKKLKHTGEE